MSHLLELIQHIERTHHLPRETVCWAIETALAAAARRQYPGGDILATVDRTEGTVSVLLNGDALDPNETLVSGDGREFGNFCDRLLREAAARSTIERYRHRTGDLASGVVETASLHGIVVRLSDGAEGLLPIDKLIPGERIDVDQKIDGTVDWVGRDETGRAIVKLARNGEKLLVRYLESSCSAICDGLVVVERAARCAGYRSKVLLRATRPDIDAVAEAAGPRGERLRSVAARLGGERVDLVEWSSDPHEVAMGALAPATPDEILAQPLAARLVAIVTKEQLTQANGRRDWNAKLASRLAGIDIVVRTREEHESAILCAINDLCLGLSVGLEMTLSAAVAVELAEAGIESVADLGYTDADEIAELTVITREEAEFVMERFSECGKRRPLHQKG